MFVCTCLCIIFCILFIHVHVVTCTCFVCLLFIHVIICLFVCLGPYTFSIGDTRSLGEFKKGGTAIQCKIPRTFNFVSHYNIIVRYMLSVVCVYLFYMYVQCIVHEHNYNYTHNYCATLVY